RDIADSSQEQLSGPWLLCTARDTSTIFRVGFWVPSCCEQLGKVPTIFQVGFGVPGCHIQPEDHITFPLDCSEISGCCGQLEILLTVDKGDLWVPSFNEQLGTHTTVSGGSF